MKLRRGVLLFQRAMCRHYNPSEQIARYHLHQASPCRRGPRLAHSPTSHYSHGQMDEHYKNVPKVNNLYYSEYDVKMKQSDLSTLLSTSVWPCHYSWAGRECIWMGG